MEDGDASPLGPAPKLCGGDGTRVPGLPTGW